MKIIYKTDQGNIAVVHPTEESLAIIGLEAIALKDVPFGKPFKYIEASAIPVDRSNWTVDDSEFTDGIGADYGAGSDNEVVGWYTDKTPIIKKAQK